MPSTPRTAQVGVSSPKSANPAGVPNGSLPWPDGLDPTPARLAVYRLFAALPPGLTICELARRMDRGESKAYEWAELFRYPWAFRKKIVDYSAVDWSLPDAEIARQLNATRQAVGLARRRLGKGRSPGWPGRRVRTKVDEVRHRPPP